MKVKRVLIALVFVALAASLVAADDGAMFRRNISKTPDGETEKAAIAMMGFYVPAQDSAGVLTDIEYYDAEGGLVETRDMAKPLVAVYIDGIEEEVVASGDVSIMSIMGGVSFGQHDAFSALSLDDGATWKRSNLSDSADLSSFILRNGREYPGDVHNMTFAVAGDRVLAGWLSKYCESGAPAYSLEDDAEEPLYPDLFGVAGSQGSVDYTLQGWPEIGEIPYSCVWTARGTLELDDETGLYDIVWRKAERLTSGRRDANRLEIAGETEAGFMMVWQEDPKGLRPGQGLGPGEGWSGAIVNQKTDIWYTNIAWEGFDQVCNYDSTGSDTDTCIPVSYEEYEGTEKPKIAVPFAMPVRMTDNSMCKYNQQTDTNGDVINPYCYEDFNGNGTADFCASSENWTNPGGTTLDLCVAEDGRVLWGRNGASRPRISLRAYDQDGDGVNDSAWVVMAYEELKALGEGGAEDVEIIDIGKNIWYHTFDMFEPDLVAQGAMLNQPAVDRETGAFFELLTDEFENEFYETEISRRFNIMTQSADKALASESKTVGIMIYKQGILNQGGPADIFLRRFVLPDPFDPAVDNPYAFENMVCSEWEYTDGSNARYVEGLCLDPGINVSGNTIVTCEDDTSGETCADAFPWDGGEAPFPKVTQWEQTVDNLDDQAWENPFDVAKGHRGFIDGDFIMMMYAWAPNWKANSVGNDHYNLYIRRSFDGGLTWTTTPADLGGDNTETCENYGTGGQDVTTVCTTYGAGEFEQARNVSQLIGNKITILDPRYTPSGGPRQFVEISTMADGTAVTPYDDDIRAPSFFFIIYETGDNTTVAEGEAVPLDLFYSRAYDWGDDYDLVDYYKDKDGDGTPELVEEWDWLEHDQDNLSGEASVTANPGGTFFYAVWNQWCEHEEDGHEVMTDSDIWYRRVMYLDDTEALPTATILASPPSAVDYDAGELTFVGTGEDNDRVGEGQYGRGIDAYVWTSDLDGELSDEQSFSIPVTDLSLGLHTFSLTVQDNEGNRASASVTVGVGVPNTSLFTLYLPIIIK